MPCHTPKQIINNIRCVIFSIVIQRTLLLFIMRTPNKLSATKKIRSTHNNASKNYGIYSNSGMFGVCVCANEKQMKQIFYPKNEWKRWVNESTDRRLIKITSCEIMRCLCVFAVRIFSDAKNHGAKWAKTVQMNRTKPHSLRHCCLLMLRLFVFRAQSNYAFVIARYWIIGAKNKWEWAEETERKGKRQQSAVHNNNNA